MGSPALLQPHLELLWSRYLPLPGGRTLGHCDGDAHTISWGYSQAPRGSLGRDSSKHGSTDTTSWVNVTWNNKIKSAKKPWIHLCSGHPMLQSPLPCATCSSWLQGNTTGYGWALQLHWHCPVGYVAHGEPRLEQAHPEGQQPVDTSGWNREQHEKGVAERSYHQLTTTPVPVPPCHLKDQKPRESFTLGKQSWLPMREYCKHGLGL